MTLPDLDRLRAWIGQKYNLTRDDAEDVVMAGVEGAVKAGQLENGAYVRTCVRYEGVQLIRRREVEKRKVSRAGAQMIVEGQGGEDVLVPAKRMILHGEAYREKLRMQSRAAYRRAHPVSA